ncbi:MAG TPA: TetR family transcriptional regulator [Rhizomicrobium sp.]|jgi:localization factor PodJL|nr:TetR family transcriptional regulator [Rhizomicrobium sp.]
MAKEALNTQDIAWQHAETRAAILGAARALLAKDDGAGLSLDAVADATNLAHATIYAYFATRQDMLVSMLCDDVAAFARTLHDTFPFSEPPEPVTEPVPVTPLFAPVAEATPEPEPVAEETPEPEPVAEEPPQEPATDVAPEVFSETLPETAQPSGDEIADIKQAIAKLEGRRVDAWLERRLRVFEKTLADLETRMTTSEASVTRATGVVDENLKTFGQRAEALEKRQREASDSAAERLEAGDRKARGSAAELRAALNDVYGRLEKLEIAKGIAVTPSPPLDAQWEAGETVVAPVEKPVTDEPYTAAAETYLSAARRAAKTAAELAEIERGNSFVAAARKSWTRTRIILAACVALGVVLVVIGLMMNAMMPSPHPIVRPAVHVPPPVHVAVAKPAPAAPAKPIIVAPKPDMALYRVTALASTGNEDAELLLGSRMLDGDGVAKDDAKAAQLFQQSAGQGNAIAQYWLGTLYERGGGVKKDEAAAWRWYQSAAKKGNVKAMYNLAVADARGKGAKANVAQAAHWFWVAAMQGYVDAQYNLAVLYERGQGVPQSLVNAYKWYAIAAAAGDKDSKAAIDVLKTQLKPAELSAGEHAASAYKPNPVDRAANTLPDPSALPGG